MGRRTKNAAVIDPKELIIGSSPDTTGQRKIRIREKSAQLVTPAQRLAESVFCERNYLIHDFQKKFPHNVKAWTVDERYPMAKGGPMFFDYPRSEQEIELCKLKGKKIREIGYRYAYVTNDMDEQAIAEQIYIDEITQGSASELDNSNS